jgi:hypothetical protein
MPLIQCFLGSPEFRVNGKRGTIHFASSANGTMTALHGV